MKLEPRDISARAELLHETGQRHDVFEKSHQKHDWWDWYAVYMLAREHGSGAGEAAAEATRFMEEAKGVLPI